LKADWCEKSTMQMKRKLASFMALALAFLVAIVLKLDHVSAAYQAYPWSDPSLLTTEATSPIIMADSAGDLHLFYVGGSEDAGGQDARTIFYMSRIEGQWAPPLDILFSSGGAVSPNGATVDASGNLHLSWNDGDGTYHSWVHASLAWNARNWQTDLVLAGRWPTGELVQSADGRLHLVLVTDFTSVVYLYSDNGGDSWSQPVTVDRVFDNESSAIGGAQIAVDTGGGLHVTWYQTALEVDWNMWSVWYGRSSDGGNNWLVTEMATPLFGESDIAVDGENNLHLVYGRNIRYGDGRWHQWSQDRGVTWSAARPLFGAVDHASGSTGGYGFAMDGDNRLNLVSSYGRKDGEASAWHLVWLGERWSEPTQLMDIRYHAHFPRLAVSGGNELNFIATSARMANLGLFEMRSSTDSSPVELHPLPPPIVEAVVNDMPDSGNGTGEITSQTGPRIQLSDEARMAPPMNAPFDSVLIAVGAVALVILSAIMMGRRSSIWRR
jgi:hypothetical protein